MLCNSAGGSRERREEDGSTCEVPHGLGRGEEGLHGRVEEGYGEGEGDRRGDRSPSRDRLGPDGSPSDLEGRGDPELLDEEDLRIRARCGGCPQPRRRGARQEHRVGVGPHREDGQREAGRGGGGAHLAPSARLRVGGHEARDPRRSLGVDSASDRARDERRRLGHRDRRGPQRRGPRGPHLTELGSDNHRSPGAERRRGFLRCRTWFPDWEAEDREMDTEKRVTESGKEVGGMSLQDRIEMAIAECGITKDLVVVTESGAEHRLGELMDMLVMFRGNGQEVHRLTTKRKANVLYDEDADLRVSRIFDLTIDADGQLTLVEILPEPEEVYVPWSKWDLSEEILWIASYGWHRSNSKKWAEGTRRFQGGWKVYIMRDNQPVCIMKNQMTSQLKKFLMDKVAPKYRLAPVGDYDMGTPFQFVDEMKKVKEISCDIHDLNSEMTYQKKIEGKASLARLDGYAPRKVFAFQMNPRRTGSVPGHPYVR